MAQMAFSASAWSAPALSPNSAWPCARYQGTMIEYGLIVLLVGRLIMGYTMVYPKKKHIVHRNNDHPPWDFEHPCFRQNHIQIVPSNYQTWNMSTQYVSILLFNMCITYRHIVYKSISRISEQPTNCVCVYFLVCLEMRHSAGKKQNETAYQNWRIDLDTPLDKPTMAYKGYFLSIPL